MKIVKFNTGGYGITKGFWFWRQFLDIKDDRWWPVLEVDLVIKYCIYPSVHSVQERLSTYVDKLTWENLK